MEIGPRLRQVREERGFSLTRLAKRTGVSAAYLSNIETGKTVPATRVLEVIAAVFGIDASELVGRSAQDSEPMLPRSSVVKRLKSELIRIAYEDLVVKHKPWDDIGWTESVALTRMVPGRLSKTALQDLSRMGVLDERSGRYRIRLEAAGDDERGENLRRLREYHDDVMRERTAVSVLRQKVADVASRLARERREHRCIAGLYIMFRDTIVRVLPEWLIRARVPPPLFEEKRFPWLASLAAHVVTGEVQAGQLSAATQMLRDIAVSQAAPALEPAPAEFLPIVHETAKFYALLDLRRQAEAMDTLALCWLLWSSAAVALGGPRTEEALVHDWRPVIYEAAARAAGARCDLAAWLRVFGNDPLPAMDLESPASLEQLQEEALPDDESASRYRFTDAVRMPWDSL